MENKSVVQQGLDGAVWGNIYHLHPFWLSIKEITLFLGNFKNSIKNCSQSTKNSRQLKQIPEIC